MKRSFISTRESIIITIGVLLFTAIAVYVSTPHVFNNGVSQTPDSNRNTNTDTISEIPTYTTEPFAKVSPPVQSGAVYSISTGSVIARTISSGAVSTVQKLDSTESIISAAYTEKNGAMVFVRNEGSTDSAYVLRKGASSPIKLVDASHVWTGNDEPRNKRISGVSLSPNGQFASVVIVGWEMCDDRIFDVARGTLVVSVPCGATTWSPDGTRLVDAGVNGMTSVNKLALSAPNDPATFKDVEWSTVKGDVSTVYDASTHTLIRGFIAAAWRSNDRVVLQTEGDVDTGSYVLEYEITSNTLSLLAHIPLLSGQAGIVATEDYVVLMDDKFGVYTINLDTGEVTRGLTSIGFDGSSRYNLYTLGTDTAVLTVRTYRNDQSDVVTAAYGIDPASKQYWEISVKSDELFIGVTRLGTR
ncbi:MAG: hypothetical protein V1907_02535 [Candidatus Kerfeldbacteria bacterium]